MKRLQNCPLGIQTHIIERVFQWSKHLWNSSYDIVQISFNALYVFKQYTRNGFLIK